MDRRTLLRAITPLAAALAVPVTMVAAATAKRQGIRVTVDHDDPAYHRFDNLCMEVNQVFLDGKLVKEPVITADTALGYLLCYKCGTDGNVLEHEGKDVYAEYHGDVRLTFYKRGT